MRCRKKTGAYCLSFHRPRRNERVIVVEYVGPYGGGPSVSLLYEEGQLEQAKEDFEGLTGDFAVADLLAQFGYDEYGNCKRARGCGER